MFEHLIDNPRYLLEQKHKHLEAILRLATDTPILQKDYDELMKNHSYLVKDVNILSQKLQELSSRSLSN
jgi:hypothetical protein